MFYRHGSLTVSQEVPAALLFYNKIITLRQQKYWAILSGFFLHGWIEPLLIWCKKRSRNTLLERVSVLSSQWLQWLSHSGFLDMQGSFGRKPPTPVFTAPLQLCHLTQLSTWFLSLWMLVVHLHRDTFQKATVFSVGLWWGFHILTSMEEVLPLLSFYPQYKVTFLHQLWCLWVIPGMHPCFSLLTSVMFS